VVRWTIARCLIAQALVGAALLSSLVNPTLGGMLLSRAPKTGALPTS